MSDRTLKNPTFHDLFDLLGISSEDTFDKKSNRIIAYSHKTGIGVELHFKDGGEGLSHIVFDESLLKSLGRFSQKNIERALERK